MTDRHPLGCVCPTCIKIKRNRAQYRFQAPQAELIGRGATPGAATGAPGSPTATVGVSPPLGNTGETYTAPSAETVELVVDGGRIKQVTHRVPSNGECCFIDTLRFTLHQNTFLKTNLSESLRQKVEAFPPDFMGPVEPPGSTIIADEDFVREASRILKPIFGFGVSRYTGKGRDFYRDAYVLGDDFGFVCIGNAGKNNQMGTMLIELSGLGCLNAASGWEQRLYDFLSNVALRPVLTRVDLAHDDLMGDRISPDWAEQQWLAGGFTKCAGKHPNIERAGNWHLPTGAGRTLYIGSRKYSSLFARFYEKGREQGDPSSPWVRAEVEFKNADRVLPLDMLVRPSDYFIAAYPALEFLDACRTPERIAVKRRKAEIGVFHAKDVIKHQFGKYLRVLNDLYEGDSEKLIADLVCDDPNAFPPRLKVIASGLDTCPPSLHEFPILKWDIDTGRYVPAVTDKPVFAGYSDRK